MKHTQEVRVYYHDTDAYGVVWHGSYVKWLEVGRVELCEMAGLGLAEMEAKGLTWPVVDMHIRYKSPAYMNDRLIVETQIAELKPVSVKFSHIIKNAKTEKVNIIAETTVVLVDAKAGKMIKPIPAKIIKAFEN